MMINIMTTMVMGMDEKIILKNSQLFFFDWPRFGHKFADFE